MEINKDSDPIMDMNDDFDIIYGDCNVFSNFNILTKLKEKNNQSPKQGL